MNKWKLLYFRILMGILPVCFLVLTFWTCFDFFLTGVVVMITLYLFIVLYFFYTEEAEIGMSLNNSFDALYQCPSKQLK
jgi:hypothetical protein